MGVASKAGGWAFKAFTHLSVCHSEFCFVFVFSIGKRGIGKGESLGLGQDCRYTSMVVLSEGMLVPVMVAIRIGPFGVGKSPALVVAAVAAFVIGLIAILSIPWCRSDKSRDHQ
ncbi:hypothetical protein LOK49_LG03G03547 [Camellia lanceoleosa]|uniref:Uncharacterized protein n=1 Tax=Camellia lanceoleosa TaxID=1840588 RepID=A0ACC0I8L7_9ERIC|nr:hypothetical protein LOK49_LG03G03547 [Camellia lanceoleosa]